MGAWLSSKNEWLETDGLGGFASGTVSGIRTRRYHALLLAAMNPPTGRVVLVNGFDAWVETPTGRYALSSQKYGPAGVVHPDGQSRILSFSADPWPTWVYRLEDGTEIEQSLFIPHGQTAVVLTWKLLTPRPMVSLAVRPFLSGRDYHTLHHENAAFRFDAEDPRGPVEWRPYEDLPKIVVRCNGNYRQEPMWYRNFLYEEEQARGLDFSEDLASPGITQFDLSREEAVWILAAEQDRKETLPYDRPALELAEELRESEFLRRKKFISPLERAADGYIVRRGSGNTIMAGYPWFTDWGRDTFIALRGLCLATGRFDVARQILLEWARAVSEGMLPNLFPDRGGTPEYNSVDASLWYIIAVHDFLAAQGRAVNPIDRDTLETAVQAILHGYSRGTRYGIRMEADGLLAAGVPGVQLTWMDAKVGDWVVTPRIGKPVEIQALWINALRIGGHDADARRATVSFESRFWNAQDRCLYDVVDADHIPGKVDPTFRPNQIFAVGGLPFSLLEGERARQVVDAVEAKLWTPVGLRSLAPGEMSYAPRYEGGVLQRDGSYHQGTVWPWLIGAFVEAWVRVRGGSATAKREAKEKFLVPLLEHLDEAGLGHVSEIADAEPPHTPRGCPYQAWSVGELLRVVRILDTDAQTGGTAVGKRDYSSMI